MLVFQFSFSLKVTMNSLIKGITEIEKRADVMQKMLEKIKEKPEYEEMKGQVSEFIKLAKIHGIQQASAIVVVGRKIG